MKPAILKDCGYRVGQISWSIWGKKVGKLSDFLMKNSVVAGDMLPLVHSTSAHAMRGIIERAHIEPQFCNVFKENLNYFFVGRPSYKYSVDEKIAQDWQLPCCFVFDYYNISGLERVFPFDTGAFDGKKLPEYISMMDLNEFEVSRIADGPHRIIGAFFGNSRSYFNLKPKSKDAFQLEFTPSAFEHEALALNQLSQIDSSPTFDDRRLAIEIQSKHSLSLDFLPPIAVIAPKIYFDEKKFFEKVVNDWKAQPISYDIFSLSVLNYYSQIYGELAKFYELKGFF